MDRKKRENYEVPEPHKTPTPSIIAPGCAKKMKGKNINEAAKIKNSEIAEHLSLPPVKIHCSMLAEEAVKAAEQLPDLYRQKPIVVSFRKAAAEYWLRSTR